MTKEELIALGIDEETAQKVVDGYTASHVAKTALEAEQSKVADLTQQLTDRDTQLETLKGEAANSSKLKEQIQALQTQNAEAAAEYQQSLAQKDFDFALSDALRGAKAKNPKAVKALLDIEKVKLDGSQLLGLEEQLAMLKESDAYLFEKEGVKGNPLPGGQGTPPAITKEQFNAMNVVEKTKLFNDNHELYKQLSE